MNRVIDVDTSCPNCKENLTCCCFLGDREFLFEEGDWGMCYECGVLFTVRGVDGDGLAFSTLIQKSVDQMPCDGTVVDFVLKTCKLEAPKNP